MANSIFTTSRSLLLAGALAFAALPALAQTAPSTQPPAPAAGNTVAPGAASTAQPVGKSATDQGKTANTVAPGAASTAQPVGKSATDQGKMDQVKSTKKVVHKTDKTSKTKVHTVAAKKPAAKPAQPGGTATDPAKMDPAKKS